jgi:all-trans-retinol 13,14-reductase
VSNSSYDAIIIGSGLGGLSTAAFLVRNEKRVLLLEQHTVPGGFTHTFKRKGFEWDVGVHYVGQVHLPHSLMRKVFDYVSGGKIEWSSIGRVYDRVHIAEKQYDFVAGEPEQLAEWLRVFPGEETAIREYLRLVRRVGRYSGWFFGERSMPWWLHHTVGFFMRRQFLQYARKTTFEVLSALTSNPELLAVLSAQCGDYGLPPAKSSFAVHAGLVQHYLDGASYPVGGASSLHEAILSGIRERGGELRLGCEVESILAEGNCAVGVRLRTGEEIFAKQIVSNAGARNTFTKLWPSNVAKPARALEELAAIQPSIAHVCAYVGLNGSDAELGLPKNNEWLYASRDFDGEYERRKNVPSHDPLLTYISFPSAKDPAWPERHPNRATVQIIAPCPFAWVEAWSGKGWMNRGSDYLEYKAKWREALLEKLYALYPQTRGRVEHCEISTPLSTSHFSKHARGEIYGLEHTPRRMLADSFRAHTPLRNLFLTGQDVVMVGVGGALFSGVVTAVAMLRRNVLWPVLRRNSP